METRTAARFLDGLIVAKPMRRQGVTLFPVCYAGQWMDARDGIAPLAEGVVRGEVSIGETGDMKKALIRNTGSAPAAALDGEVIAGGAQDRMIVSAAIIAPGASAEVPSCCVEVNRWDAKAAKKAAREENAFTPAGFAYGSLRRLRMEMAEHSLLAERTIELDQRGVWRNIAQCFGASGASTKTLSMVDLFSYWNDMLREYEQRFILLKGQAGIIAFLGKRTWFIDIFGSYDMLAGYFRPLVRSYAFDDLLRIESGKQIFERDMPGQEDASRVMKSIKLALCHRFESAGSGESMFFSTRDGFGTVMHTGGSLAHLSACSRHPESREGIAANRE